jgi:hypothetical protein
MRFCAGREKVRDTQIEKDYVLSWMLWGIGQSPTLRQGLVFKGGTVLKKAYFPDYRFSEDLDFTLDIDLTDETIAQEFTLASPTERHQSGSIAFYLYFLGPLGGKMGSRSVKVDITRGEKILFAPVERDMYNRYADCPDDPAVLRCIALGTKKPPRHIEEARLISGWKCTPQKIFKPCLNRQVSAENKKT